MITFDIYSIADIAPSLKAQILYLIDQRLDLSIPRIPLVKYPTRGLLSPQKFLQRTEGAKNTIFIREDHLDYNTILLIGDSFRSGATLNESAIKLKTA